MDETVGIWISLGVAALVGLILGFVLMKTIWIAVGLTGVAAGFALGSFIYGCILATTGWDSYWGMIGIAGVCAVVGGFLTFGLGKPIIVLATSLVGSYIFTRGLTLVLADGYPSEAEIIESLKHGAPVEFDWHFWLYLAIFATTFILTLTFQFTSEEEHEDFQRGDFQRQK